jgi:predicted enzyme related to lactoylglutathione lyase
MGRRERYEPGTFCWVDLATTDPAGAKTFYGELFGWEAEDMPAGEAGTYMMLCASAATRSAPSTSWTLSGASRAPPLIGSPT